jgi:TolB protein
VPRFAVVPNDDQGLGRKIAQIIARNLGRSGTFTIIDESFFGDRASPIDEAPAFFAWRQIGAQALLIGRISQSGDGFDVRVQLWDITAGKQLSEQWYSTRAESVAEAADRISEMVNAQLARRNDK